MRINIAPKLFFGFLVVIFLNVWFFMIVSKMEALNSIANVQKHQNEVKNDLLIIKTNHKSQGLSVSNYQQLALNESVSNFRKTNDKIIYFIDTLSHKLNIITTLDKAITGKTRLGRSNGSDTLNSLAKNIRLYNNLYKNIFDSLVVARSSSTAAPVRLKTLFTALGDVDSQLTEVLEVTQNVIDEQTKFYIKEVEIRVNSVKQLTVVILTGVTLFAVVFGLWFSKAITNSLRRLKLAASIIAKGDFDFDPSGYPSDEIGDLATALFDMAVDLKNAQEELVRSKRMAAIGEVVASVNHEINNPLMIISGNAQFLEMMMGEYPEEMKERVKAILEETERISQVTRKLREIKNPVVEDYTSSGEQMINLEKSSL